MKQWRLFFPILFFTTMISMHSMLTFAKDTGNVENIIASFSGVLQVCIIQDRKFQTVENLLDKDKWSHVYWPSYDEVNKDIYFAASGSPSQVGKSNIYRLSLLTTSQEPKKIMENARHPALSPDKKTLAFYRHPNQLWIKSLGEMNTEKVVCDIANYQPCVWSSNKQLLYIDLDNNLILLDVQKGKNQETGYNSIVPGALSPDGKIVICGSSDGKKIYFYYLTANKLKLILHSKFRSVGTSFIWLSNGNYFLFTIQSWANLLRLNESRNLFLFTISNQEKTSLLGRTALFGGASMPGR